MVQVNQRKGQTIKAQRVQELLREIVARCSDSKFFNGQLRMQYDSGGEAYWEGSPAYFLVEDSWVLALGFIPWKKTRNLLQLDYYPIVNYNEVKCWMFDPSVVDIVKPLFEAYANANGIESIELVEEFQKT